jgi:Tfp pilus assembly protein PilF
MNQVNQRAGIGAGSVPRFNRSRAWLALVCLLSFVATGCKSVAYRASSKTLDTPSELKGSSVGEKTEFRREVGASQEVAVHLDLARALESQGNLEGALAECQKAIDASDGPLARRGDFRVTTQQKSLAHRRMGGVLDRLGRFAQAETHYREALKLNPNDVNVWNDAGYSYYLQSRWPEAERSLLQAAKLDPQNQRVQTNLGLALAGAGKLDGALAALTNAGGAAVANANLGYILAATGKPDLARRYYEAAIELQPQFEAARYALARLDAADSPPPLADPPIMTGPAMATSITPTPAPTPRAAVVVPAPIRSASTPVSIPVRTSAPIVVPTPIAMGVAYSASSNTPNMPISATTPLGTQGGTDSVSSRSSGVAPKSIDVPLSESAAPLLDSSTHASGLTSYERPRRGLLPRLTRRTDSEPSLASDSTGIALPNRGLSSSTPSQP